MTLPALLLGVALATPFQDVHERFTIDLPPEWEFAPMPGDVGGASFRCKREHVVALASVRVIKVGAGTQLSELAKRVGAAAEKEPGYKRLVDELDILAGMPAVRRRYQVNVDKEGKLVKTVEQRIAIGERQGYVVHVESVAETFPAFEAEFAHLFGTFRPVDRKGTKAKRMMASPVVGAWAMAEDPSAVLTLRADGSLSMGGAGGVYRVEGKRLIARLQGGGEETFTWELIEGDLVLSSPSLDAPIRYRKLE